MVQRFLVYCFVLCGVIFLSGCGSSGENSEEELIPGIPSPFVVGGTCSNDSECILTDKVYDPCGSVYAIHVNTSQETIDGYNELQMTLDAGKQYDCDVPPQIEDFRAICQQKVCTLIQK